MALPTYSGNGLLNRVFRNQALTISATYLSLHTADPGLTGANECVDATYARQSVSWASATTAGVATNATLTFPALTGAVTVTHVALWDASTSGNCLWTLDVTDRAYTAGQSPRIASGNLTITIDAQVSNYLIPLILDHLVGNAAYTPASTVYAALYTSNPTAADSGTEVTGTAYARVAITFSAASGRAIDTAGDVDFGTAGAGGWGTITHYGIRDASTAGNLLYFGTVSGGGDVASGDTVVITGGSFDIAWN